MKLVAISDTHNRHDMLNLPDDGIILHAGDAMTVGKQPQELLQFAYWWNRLPQEKYYTPGNHDKFFDSARREHWLTYKNMITGIKIDETVQIGNTKIWFSPWSNKFKDWSFMAPEERLEKIYQQIPANTNIIVTHGPAFGILDRNRNGIPSGSTALALALMNLPDLKLVICGHIHEGRGHLEKNGVVYMNASNCGVPYSDFRPNPFVIDYDEHNNEVRSIDEYRTSATAQNTCE